MLFRSVVDSALIGSSRLLSVGPESTTALMTATVVAPDPMLAHLCERTRFHRYPQPARRIEYRILSTEFRARFEGTEEVFRNVEERTTRDALIRDLKRRAYFGISAAQSMGTDGFQLLSMRSENIPGAARYMSAGRGITMPEPGRITAPHWINNEAEGRKAVEELADKKVDIVKIWVDTRAGQYKKISPEVYAAIIQEAHKRNLRVIAHGASLASTTATTRKRRLTLTTPVQLPQNPRWPMCR